VRWNRRVRRGDARLWAAPSGVVRALPDGVARISDAGTLAFRAPLPGGAPSHLACGERVLFCAASGSLVALDESDGAPAWKRRVRGEIIALAAATGRALVLARERRGGARLAAFAAHSGKLLWERPLAGGTELVLSHDSALVAHGRSVACVRLADGTLRFEVALGFGPLRLACGDDAVIATGPGGAAARIDERGAPSWTLAEEGADPAAPAIVQRGVVLLARGGAALHDAREGLPIAHLGPTAPLCTALAPDLSVAVCDAGGAVSLHRLATHLSVVTT
jgi:outer membrane protein assembly factor BamB